MTDYRSHSNHGYWLARLKMGLSRALDFHPDYEQAELVANQIACLCNAIRANDKDQVMNQCAGAESLLNDFEAARR